MEKVNNDTKLDEKVSEKLEPKKKSGKTHEVFLVETMLKKYRSKYESKVEQSTSPEQLKEKKKKREQADQWIDSIVQSLEKFESVISSGTKVEIANSISEINKQLEKGANISLTIEQAERLRELVYSDFFRKQAEISAKPKNTVLILQTFSTRQMERAIIREVSETQDIDRLKELQALIPESSERRTFEIGNVDTIIKGKISKIEQELNLKRLQQEILPGIHKIAQGIVSGNLDMNQAEAIINEIVARKLKGSSNKFSLTEEQQRKQVYIMIRIALREHSKKYPIKNAEQAMGILDDLTEGETEINLNAVVENLIARKQFSKAREICYIYRKNGEKSKLDTYIIRLQKKITIAEIGDLVSISLNKQMTDEQKEIFWKTLKGGIDKNNLSLSSVVIGKSQDGTKTITLQDIWPEKREKIK